MSIRRSIFNTVIASAFALALSLDTSLAQGAKPVRIGFSIAKTGIFASAAPSQLNAYELWREQVNARGGLEIGKQKGPVEFVMYDDQSNPAQAAKIYEKLVTDDKVDLLLAPWGTPMHVAVAPVVGGLPVPLV